MRAGLEALQRGNVTEARAQLESAAKLEPSRASGLAGPRTDLLEASESRAGGTSAPKAGQLAPDDPAVLRGLVLFYSQTGDYEKAADAQLNYASRALLSRERRPRDPILFAGEEAQAGY